ncbi:hypothetical protein MBANPS3_000295 [Mucor bainieri]
MNLIALSYLSQTLFWVNQSRILATYTLPIYSIDDPDLLHIATKLVDDQQVKRLDVIELIQKLRAIKSQAILDDDHAIWNCLNQDHYDFLSRMMNSKSYTVDITQFNNVFDEQVDADIARRLDEEENRLLPQATAGAGNNFEEATVQNLNGGGINAPVVPMFPEAAFYIRQATFTRDEFEKHMRQCRCVSARDASVVSQHTLQQRYINWSPKSHGAGHLLKDSLFNGVGFLPS